jgi:hypothetical protein
LGSERVRRTSTTRPAGASLKRNREFAQGLLIIGEE